MPDPIKTRSSQPSVSVDTIQRYGRIMKDVMETYFPILLSAPNSFYIMMATMEAESSYRILHGTGSPTANHATISVLTGIGKSYWLDPVVERLKSSVDPTVRANLIEGLSAKALMGTMGMYQVRNCKESNSIMSGGYRSTAESLGLMVNAGESISDTFPDDDTGARNSMVLGCMIMEHKYKIRKTKFYSDMAMRLAAGDYLGKAKAADVLGTTPEARVSLIYGGLANNNVLAAKLFSNTNNYFKTGTSSKGQAETKTSTEASTQNAPVSSIDCKRSA
jgi:hypothetical protein